MSRHAMSHVMPFGAALGADGAVQFRLWAPDAKRVVLKARSAQDGELQADLNEAGEGWFELNVSGFGAGAEYSYRIDDEVDVPDPASRCQPRGVAGPGMLIDPEQFVWTDDAWKGRSWEEAVLYELHVGCFTREGTYAAAIERLDALVELGVTAIEVMPLATFPGERGWGYDGVLLFAPHHAYGPPEELKRFVDAAHARGLMVLLDVVYNHFGPQGNYLARYAREFFTARHKTPWGDAINFAQPVVRQFFIHNALYWIEEFHFDGLRVDAVHAMYDESPVHFIDELIEAVKTGPGATRQVHIVLENERNEAKRLKDGVAQWNDDFHHAVHVILTDERDGYYIDYAERPLDHLGRVLTQGFAYQGERSTFSGHPRGESSAQLPPLAFVNFLQNHDQVGNRAFGERLAHLAELDRLRGAVAVLVLAPQIPMFFMGGEYAASQPFLYFCDYEGELADAVREGRRAEFGRFAAFADESVRATIPDPNARATFERCELKWEERGREPHAAMLAHVKTLLAVRRDHVAPRIAQIRAGESTYEINAGLLTVRWPLRNGNALRMHANLADAVAPSTSVGRPLYSTHQDARDAQLEPWEVRLSLEA